MEITHSGYNNSIDIDPDPRSPPRLLNRLFICPITPWWKGTLTETWNFLALRTTNPIGPMLYPGMRMGILCTLGKWDTFPFLDGDRSYGQLNIRSQMDMSPFSTCFTTHSFAHSFSQVVSEGCLHVCGFWDGWESLIKSGEINRKNKKKTFTLHNSIRTSPILGSKMYV